MHIQRWHRRRKQLDVGEAYETISDTFLHTGVTHVCNVREAAYLPWGLHSLGGDVPPGTLY